MKRIALLLLFAAALPALADSSAFDRARALAAEANWKEALPLYEEALSSSNAVAAMACAVDCLHRLGEHGRVDEPVEKALAAHPDDPEVAVAAARHFRTAPHWGSVQDGVFLRGQWGGSKMLDTAERDRVRAVAILLPLAPAVERLPHARHVRVEFFRELAFALRSGRAGDRAWRLFEKTDFSALPEPERDRGGSHASAPAPVGPDGDPLFHALPASWEAAETDGERWRWALRRATAAYREWEAEARKWGEFEPEPSFESCMLADYFSEQYSPRTLAAHFPDADALDAALGVSGLGDDESVAWTARGARRFRVPDDWNPARFLRFPDAGRPAEPEELSLLGQFRLDRLQLDKAAEAFRAAGDSRSNTVAQIVDPRVDLDDRQALQTPARPPVVAFSHRNAAKVSFILRPLDLGKLAADVRECVSAGKPFRPFADNRYLYGTGLDHPRQLFEKDGSSPWLGAPVARWEQALEPRPGHRTTRGAESRAPAALPAGVYLVEATPEGGRPSHALLRVEALALVGDGSNSGRDGDRRRAFVTDAETGAPVADAEVGLFAWTCWDDGPTNLDWRTVSARTDSRGRFRLPDERFLFERETTESERAAGMDRKKTRWADDWILSVAAPDGARLFCERRDFMGRPSLHVVGGGDEGARDFLHEWWDYGDPDDTTWRDGHVPVSVTDRPAYRPGDTVRYKVWLSRRRFDLPDVSPWAGQRVRLVVKNPKDEEVWDKTYVADDFGGFDGEMPVPADAPLGVWTIRVSIHGKGGYGLRLAGSFRVEEYRKPEFEVAVETPAGVLELGQEAKATIRARYLFGAPVAGATAKVTVTRTTVPDVWSPPCRWDWLYGGGYGCFGCDWTWHPAWNGGRGWCRPWAWTVVGDGWRGWSPPEEVLRTTVELGADGTAEVSWDTAAARAAFGDDADQHYRVAVEVTDAARRTIDAAGEVVAAARPFRVRAWADRAVVRADEPVELRAFLAAPGGSPLPDGGALRGTLCRYDPATGQETVVPDVPFEPEAVPGDPATRRWRLKPARGQYRFVAVALDGDGERHECSVPFTVLGPEGDEARDIRFAPLELVPDRPDYAPGDVARVLVAADEPDGWVHLVLRAGTARAEERWMHLEGKTATVELKLDADDCPGVFVEAFAVRAGRIHRATRELAVPPVSKEARVEVEVPAEARPGDEVEATVRVFGPDGAPAASASAAMAVYDLAVERFAGGSNVPSLLGRFWGWHLALGGRRENTLEDLWWVGLDFDGDSRWYDLGPFAWPLFRARSFGWHQEDGFYYAREDLKRKTAGFALAGPEPAGRMIVGGSMELAAAAAPAAEGGAYFNAAAPSFAAVAAVTGFYDTDGLPDAFEGAFAAADGALPEVALRTKFADTAFWGPRLRPVPGEPGVFRARFAMPEDVTGWRARVWAVLPGMCVGEGDARLVTRKPFVLRPVLPRFLVEGDVATLSAIVHNDTDETHDFRVTLALPETNAVLAVEARPSRSTLQPFNPFNCSTDLAVPAHSSERFDVPVRALREGEAQLELRAVCREGGDGVARTLPVRVHGMQRTESFAAVLAPDRRSATIEFTVPAERRPELSAVELRLETSPLEAMLCAIPFLLEYPHGCTEQTLNRFVPAAIARKALADAGVDLAVFAEHAANWRADYEARGKGGWWATNGVPNAVVDDAELARIVAAGVERLAAMQLSDGGWGWFSGTGERSWPHTTATVVHGLHAARDAGADVPADLLARGERWLAARVAERADEIAKHRKDGARARAEDALLASVLAEGGASDARMLDFLFEDRADLPLRAKALLGLAFHRLGDAARRDALVRNCRQFLKEDPATGVWRFETPERGWWWWCDDIEAQSAGLRLLAAAGAEEDAPAVFGLSLYLLQNRRHATFWKSTRDTALAIEALAAAAKGKTDPIFEARIVDVFLDGRQVFANKTLVVGVDTFLLPGPEWELRGDALTPGKHTLEIRWPHKSEHPWLYATVLKTDFTKERPIPPAGLQVKVKRSVERLTPETGAATAPDASGAPVALATTRFAREPLADGAAVRAGDLLEVTLEVEADNDYEYLLLEDRKAAGFEAVDALSGYRWDGALCAYVEHRDDRTCFYLRSLPRGVHSLSYRLRAETPGTLAALPATLAGMYDPDLRANSAEQAFSVADAPAPRPAAAESAELEPHAESAELEPHAESAESEPHAESAESAE